MEEVNDILVKFCASMNHRGGDKTENLECMMKGRTVGMEGKKKKRHFRILEKF